MNSIVLPPLDEHAMDKSLAQPRIPTTLLEELRHVNEFSSHDFQVDGVFAVYEDGHHTATPVAVRPKFEWRKYGTPSLGLRWRRIPVDASDEYDAKLDPMLVAKQTRMTQRALEAFGHEDDFIVSEADRVTWDKEKSDKLSRFKREQSEDLARRIEAVKALQARLRRRLLGPLHPWYHIARLATFSPNVATTKKSKAHRSQAGQSHATAPTMPVLPWCSCWTSLEATFELGMKATQQMRQVLSDFEAGEYETCLRRVDNMVAHCNRKKSPAIDHVLVELAALCNRFGMRLFFLGKMEHANTFFSRVLNCTHPNNALVFDGKPELYAWTCDLVAYCLWTQGKFEESHWTLSRSSSLGDTIPFNASLVTHIHACQLLFKLDKPDMVISLGAKVLFRLLQARHELAVSQLKGSPSAHAGQILQVVEHPEERGLQPHSPTFLTLLGHAAQTVAFALARKGRLQDAVTVAEVVLREVDHGGEDTDGVRGSLRELLSWVPHAKAAARAAADSDMTAHASLALSPSGTVLPRAKGATAIPTYSQAASAATMKPSYPAWKRSAALSGGSRSPSRSFDSTDEPPIARVSVGSVAFEPSTESSWAPEFFGDIYWQRHTDKRSQLTLSPTYRARPPFR